MDWNNKFGDVMINNPVGWFEIVVQDIERAKNFYENVFQIKLERLNNSVIEMWGFSQSDELFRSFWLNSQNGGIFFRRK